MLLRTANALGRVGVPGRGATWSNRRVLEVPGTGHQNKKRHPRVAFFILASLDEETSNQLFDTLEEWDRFLTAHVPMYQEGPQ